MGPCRGTHMQNYGNRMDQLWKVRWTCIHVLIHVCLQAKLWTRCWLEGIYTRDYTGMNMLDHYYVKEWNRLWSLVNVYTLHFWAEKRRGLLWSQHILTSEIIRPPTLTYLWPSHVHPSSPPTVFEMAIILSSILCHPKEFKIEASGVLTHCDKHYSR